MVYLSGILTHNGYVKNREVNLKDTELLLSEDFILVWEVSLRNSN